MYGPLIDSPPSHPETVMTTMDYLSCTLKSLGMHYVHLTLDMQLYIVACLIKWNDPTRWKNVILRPEMMHTLMSFLGTIGHNMKGTGAEELVGAAYSGLTSIFSGKAWPKAMQAFRMVTAALLHDFLQTGEKSHDDIVAYLEKAREHPIGKLWVDCFIQPTMLAHQFLRAESEGDWLLQQHCLKMMLPYFFSAGHIIMHDTSPGTCRICNTYHRMPRMIFLMEVMCVAILKELLQYPVISLGSRHKILSKESKLGE